MTAPVEVMRVRKNIFNLVTYQFKITSTPNLQHQNWKTVVSEFIHTHSIDGHWKFWGRKQGVLETKVFNGWYQPPLKFLGGREVGHLLKKRHKLPALNLKNISFLANRYYCILQNWWCLLKQKTANEIKLNYTSWSETMSKWPFASSSEMRSLRSAHIFDT